jgi:hypothetical protein
VIFCHVAQCINGRPEGSGTGRIRRVSEAVLISFLYDPAVGNSKFRTRSSI